MRLDDLEFDSDNVAEFRRLGHWRDETILTVLEQHAAKNPNGIAIIGDNIEISYSALRDQVFAIAAGLDNLGIQKGDVVAAQLPNISEFIVSYLAVAAVGGVFQTIHVPYRGNDLHFLLTHASTRAFICMSGDSEYCVATTLLKQKKELPDIEFIITVGAGPAGSREFSSLASNRDTKTKLNDLGPDDPHVLLYTSGTTSNPKGVLHPSTTLLSGVRNCAGALTFTSSDRVLMLSNFTHMWGLVGLIMTLYKGASVLLIDKFLPETFGEATEQFSPTVVIGAPVHILKAFYDKVFKRFDVSPLRIIVTSGAPFPKEMMLEVSNSLPHAEILELWGMTEVAPVCVTRPGSSVEGSIGTVGPVLPHCQIRIVGENGDNVLNNTPGELHISGSSVFSGYHNNPGVNAEVFTDDGWFNTGDIASIDDDGKVRILGRTKETINRGGVKFMAVEVEEALASHPQIKSCAVVPTPDKIFGERACCVAITKSTLSLEEICQHLDDKGIEKVKWPERLELISEMPMTSTGKIMKGRLFEFVTQRLEGENSQDIE